jgi:hypothetical protein
VIIPCTRPAVDDTCTDIAYGRPWALDGLAGSSGYGETGLVIVIARNVRAELADRHGDVSDEQAWPSC